MGVLDQLRRMLEEPAPSYCFEVSEAGVARGIRPRRRGQAPEFEFRPVEEGALAVSPVRDNILMPERLAAVVAALAPVNGNKAGKQRETALILPDYSARITVLDFEEFPSGRDEQLALVRFRMKKAVPFDLDSAAVSFAVQKTQGRKVEVAAAAIAVEIVARYEAPFRQAGFLPGFATTSALAALNLMPEAGRNVLAKKCGRALTVAVCDGRLPKLVRCVGMEVDSMDEVLGLLFPTFAYAEDELGGRPQRMLAAGFGSRWDDLRQAVSAGLAIEAEPLRSAWGPAGEFNAGLLGWLQAREGGR